MHNLPAALLVFAVAQAVRPVGVVGSLPVAASQIDLRL
jgi:hypothetical protein